MPKPLQPLRSEDPRPRDISFTHFGVLNTGSQSKASLFTSVTVNVLLGLICLIIGAATKKVVDNRNKEIALVVPLKEKPPEPPKPKLPPPPKLPDPPKVEPPKIEPPKIKLPDVPVPEPKPVPVAAPKPMPVIVPAPPKIQAAAAAPKVVSVTMAKAASVVNNDPHPTAVALGNPNSPVPFQKSGPAVAPVNLNRGMPGMPAENSGGGPRATAVNMGSGQPTGKIGGTAVVAVAGVPHGIIGGTGTNGNGTGTQARQVQMVTPVAAPQPVATHIASAMAHPPSVLFKPKPIYTAEASSLHIEGTVTVKLRVSASGAVTVVGVVAGLGHGLDQSAVTAAQGIRFKPATDASGNPVDWEGPVIINFQIAS